MLSARAMAVGGQLGVDARRPADATRRHVIVLMQRYRQQLLNQWIRHWAELGCPLDTPEQLSETHIESLLRRWYHDRPLSLATLKNHRQFLALVCTWLDRPDLARRIKQYRAG